MRQRQEQREILTEAVSFILENLDEIGIDVEDMSLEIKLKNISSDETIIVNL